MVNSTSAAVRELLGRYPINYEFGLWELKGDVFVLYPPSKHSHADTVSRRLREFRHGKGYEIICVNPNKSRYKKITIKEYKKILKQRQGKLKNGKKPVKLFQIKGAK